jgi:NAD(P)-dependent dehydrogenase (short-subunit alcohol dehydrogenase family)
LETRTVLVPGAARGIGAATFARLAVEGHHPIGLDLEDADICADLATSHGRAMAVEQTLALTPRGVNAIVACAGLAGSDPAAMVAVNYFGVVTLFNALRGALELANDPRAVAVSSSAIILGHDDTLVEACLAGEEDRAKSIARSGDSRVIYSSTKVALSRWIRRTAIKSEWAGKDILLNAVAPGTVLTRITRPILATAEGRAMLAEATPIAVSGYAEPDDVAPLLTFLAGADCKYIVGQTIFADGGKDAIRRGDRLL